MLELLIDVTSHELRQPVSAILNCSSLVRTNLALLRDNLQIALDKNDGFHPSTELMTDITDDIEALDAIYQVICLSSFRKLLLIHISTQCGLAQGKSAAYMRFN